MASFDEVRQVVADVLQLGARAQQLDGSSPLLGAIPEFDSMAVVSVITALEQQFGIVFDDDEISAEVFQTIGTLVDFVNGKL
jgi:acyl carrier protein